MTPPCSGITAIGTLLVLPEQDVMLEEDRIALARLISATGTISPSTWQVLVPKWISVMSRMRGASRQPESLTRFRMSSGAPQARQVSACGGFWVWHHSQTMRCIGSIGSPWLFFCCAV